MTTAINPLPKAGDQFDIRCGDIVAGATVIAVDTQADTIVIQLHGAPDRKALPLSAIVKIDWYPNAGEA